MRHQEPLAKMADMWRERCRKAERERYLARRDYECMNKFREHAESQRDQLREALEELLAYGDGCNLCMDCQINQSDEWDKARAAIKATEEG